MAERNLISPDTSSLSGLLSNGITYKVPAFQRDYSWHPEQWTDLWEDIKIILQTGKSHYMGAIVLQRIADKNFVVIDGQQRLTTLSIIALAVIKNIQDLIDKGIEPIENEERIKELRRGFLGQRDPGSLLYSSKLILNENNDSFYQSKLLQLQKPLNEKSLPDTEKLLWQAFSFFYIEISRYYLNTSGEILANFLNKSIGDKIIFIKIEVEDELSAYTLFETLNYRGVDLTVTDLLKNYLFSLLSESDIRVAKVFWNKIATTVGLDKFPIFLRHYWISKHTLVRPEQLFKVIRSEIKTNNDVFELLRNLESASSIYLSLQEPFNSEWKGDREIIKRIRELKLFGINHHLPLLIVSKIHFSLKDFNKLLKLISVITFRYVVIGNRQLNNLEEIYNNIAIKIYKRNFTAYKQIVPEFKSLYVNDNDFKNDFSSLQLYSYGSNKKLIRYILFEIENLLMQGGDRDFEYDPATIEHILPENPSEEWNSFFSPSLQENYIYRLGNYTLLEDHLNYTCNDKIFHEKKVFYQKSQYEISKKILAPEWIPAAVEARQLELAKWAASIWKISF